MGGMSMGIFMILKKILMLLVLSFFVLLGASKADSEGLKKFGRILAMLMWVAVVAIIALTAYRTTTGKSCRFKKQSQKRMMMPQQQGQRPMMPPQDK
ncbi:MAG: hypothetical protein KJ619_04625 [Candidatus Omnitrophica bacterium]|nr:hypothetical protein [Candidatus Omnitrophota bacterium]